MLQRINLCNAQRITQQGASRRSTTRPNNNVVLLCPLNHVTHNNKVRSKLLVFNNRQLLLHATHVLWRIQTLLFQESVCCFRNLFVRITMRLREQVKITFDCVILNFICCLQGILSHVLSPIVTHTDNHLIIGEQVNVKLVERHHPVLTIEVVQTIHNVIKLLRLCVSNILV